MVSPLPCFGVGIPRQPYLPFFVPTLEGAFYGSVEVWFRFLAFANRFLTIAQRRFEAGPKQKQMIHMTYMIHMYDPPVH